MAPSDRPVPPQRTDAAPPRTEVRERILASAVDLFAAHGFDATSVSQVVAKAGVTKGAMYHYFAAKDDLLFEIYHTLLADQLASLDRILAMGLDRRVHCARSSGRWSRRPPPRRGRWRSSPGRAHGSARSAGRPSALNGAATRTPYAR